MVARKRRPHEDFEDYHNNLKDEAILLKYRLKGKWRYQCGPKNLFVTPGLRTGYRPYVKEKK